MAGAALIATQLTDRTTRYKRLNIGGGPDVLSQPSGSAYRFAVKQDSIEVDEQGPGGVSSMHFTIADPYLEMTLQEMADVEFWDITNNRPIFRGFLTGFEIEPTAVGRDIVCTCTGIEALLDWMLVPSLTIPAGTRLDDVIQALAANATGIGWPLRAFAVNSVSVPTGGVASSQSNPVSSYGTSLTAASLANDLVLDGQSLREACLLAIQGSQTWNGGDVGGYVSIDFYSGFRFHKGYPSTGTGINLIEPATDYATFELENTVASTRNVSEAVGFAFDSGAVVRGVYIKSTTAAGSGLVPDGSGIPGPIAYISDDTSTTAAIRNTIGIAYLAQFSQSVRASASFTPMDATLLAANNYRPGSYFDFYADAQTISTTTRFSLFSIRKTYPAGAYENWVVTFGGFAASAPRQTRRLTRAVRS